MSLLVAENLSYSYAKNVSPAISKVSITVEPGTLTALVGPNGAGKSTLMNILFGLYQPNNGTIFIDEKPVVINSPDQSIAQGIGMVHQHFMLVPTFTVLENIMLGNEGSFYLDRGSVLVKSQLNELSNKYDLRVDSDSLVSDLPVGMQQRVEILKALNRGAKILILDEPTGVLTPQETEGLFGILSLLRDKGVTIILITHSVEEALLLGERLYVMAPRPGRIHKEYNLPFAEMGLKEDLREIKKNKEFSSKREEILSMIWNMEEEIMGKDN